MRFTSSRAMPSRRSSSVTVMSRATVRLPSLATSQPGMSSLMTSTSASSTVAIWPSTSMSSLPSFSNWAIVGWSRLVSLAARAFMILPYFGPSFLKSGFTRLTRIPASLPTSLISLTLTSFLTRSATASMFSRWLSSSTGTMMACSGWRTFRFCLRRSDSTIEVMSLAACMRCSSCLSIMAGSHLGKLARCTEVSLPVRSRYRRSL